MIIEKPEIKTYSFDEYQVFKDELEKTTIKLYAIKRKKGKKSQESQIEIENLVIKSSDLNKKNKPK